MASFIAEEQTRWSNTIRVSFYKKVMYCTGLAKNPLFGPTEIGFWVFGAKTRKTPWVFGAKEPRMRRNP
jgi:hypothetical protein